MAMVSKVLGQQLMVMIMVGDMLVVAFLSCCLCNRMVDMILYLLLDTYLEGILDSFFP